MTIIGQLITGNEVLFGKTRDTNGPFMGSQARMQGARVLFSLTCGDDRSHLLNALSFLADHCDVILMTGGLGPTSDDLTAEVVARFCEVPLEFRTEAWEACVEAFARLGRKEVPESNRKQALLPKGCEIIPNPVGTAVGFSVAHSRGAQIFCLPGVPFELEPMYVASVLPKITKTGGHNSVRTWQVFFLGESAMQNKLADFEKDLQELQPNVVVAYQAHAGYVTYSVALAATQESELPAVKEFLDDFVEPRVASCLKHYVVSRSEKPFPAFLVETLAQKKLKLSVAESCTGGLLSQMICAVPGASACFESGIVSYSNEAKIKFLGVNPETIVQDGAVSEKTVIEMAKGTLKAACAQIAISLSGVAGPSGGTEINPVGTVYLALCIDNALPKDLALQSKLERFGWKKIVEPQATTEVQALEIGEAGEHPESLVFTIRIQLGSRMPRQVIQLRSSNFALGSLVVLSQLLCVSNAHVPKGS